MWRKCKVQGCTSGASRLFKFPQASTDKARLLMWLSACGNATLLDLSPDILRTRLVCERHFEAKYILAKKLSSTAVPTLHLPEQIDVSAYKFCVNVENASLNLRTNDENIKCERQVLEKTPESSFAGLRCPAINNNSNPDPFGVKRKRRSKNDDPCAKRNVQAGATSDGKDGKKKNQCYGQYSACPIIRLCFEAGVIKLMRRLIFIKLKRHSSSEQAYKLEQLQRYFNRVKSRRRSTGKQF